MPPKGQKMGSITHNSAEVNNRPSARSGIMSKLKGSFTSSGSKATAGNTGKPKKNGMTKSVAQGGASASSQNYPPRRMGSITRGANSAGAVEIPQELKETMRSGDIPTSVIALVDAASCMTDDFGQSVANAPQYRGRSDMVSQMTEPKNDNFRGSMLSSGMQSQGMASYGTSDSASRALANLHVSGGQGNDQAERGHQSADWAHTGGHNGQVAKAVQNQGYNNYTYTNYTQENYDDDGAPDYYDESGGGIFDDNYMLSSRISVSAQQPTPPDRGYNRRSSNAEEYMPSDPRGGYSSGSYNQSSHRRSSQSEGYQSENSRYYRGSGGSSSFNTNDMPIAHFNRRQSDGTDGYPPYTGLPLAPVHEPIPKRASIDNAACTPLTRPRRASVDNGMPRRSIINNNGRGGDVAAGATPSRRPSVQRSSSHRGSSLMANNPKWPTAAGESSNFESSETAERHQIVNNTGREGSSHSPNNQSHRQSFQSSSAKNNPNWFSEDINSKSSKGSHNNSESTEHHRNADELYDSFRKSRLGGGLEGGDDDDRTMVTMATMATKALALKPSAMNKAKDMKYPQGDVTIVYTDVQGSTSMWEACPSDMKKATDIHDMIMRRCYTDHSGYEITTEGDAFILAFQHPTDALAFALQAQMKLYNADWPDGILKHPDGKDEPALKFRGFRVRFGIHHGPTISRIHEMTGRSIYSGEGVKISRAVESLCHGGQILCTMETWKAVSGMAERYLGRPQLLDCGEHLLFETKNEGTTTRYTRRIMQLVPSDLAFDFFEARGRRDVVMEDGKMSFEIKDASSVNGRLFPPLTSKRQLTTCFLNAPYVNGRVTVVFVYTVGLGDNPDNRAHDLKILAKYVRKQLLVLNPPGYECQEDAGCWMLSFDRMANAVAFGLELKSRMSAVQSDLVGANDAENMFKVGILSGPFTSMGPHKTTGMADYFGPIVNRAARVASNCENGQVCVGIPLSNGVSADPPDFGPSINVKLQGIKKLKGITIDVAIFECSKRRIETPYR